MLKLVLNTKMQSSLLSFLLFTTILVIFCSRHLHAAEASKEPRALSNKDLSTIASLADTNHLKKAIDNILIPRVVGTENHEKVFRYIVKDLTNLGMDVKVDEFVEDTPIFGPLTFKNIIATSDPHAEKFLVLSCHYDSKYFENFVFEAAIDSAVPCAMIVNIAKILSNEKFKRSNKTDTSLKLIFFDGEEAFDTWGPHDSIYGAKHLARKLETNVTRLRSTGQDVSELQQIDLLILLDLIGARNPSFHSFFRNTEKWFLRLAEIETQLRRSNLLENHHQSYFKKSRPHGQIEDDHIPFLIRGVPILHLITVPFPPEWHTIDDNRGIIDMSTIKNINLILTAFVVDYLRLLV